MKKGFTIIEMLIVVAIVSIVLACLFPLFALSCKQNRNTQSNFTVVTDEYVGGQHIQIIEDNNTHTQTKLVNDQAVSETPPTNK